MDAARPSTVSKKRHRFQRVEERVANLQTELQLHVKTNANELALTFVEELGLQGELTTIESFQVLYRKLQPLVTTTPQLLHHLSKFVRLLKAELTAEPVADIQRDRIVPVLKLITALARELRKEFYPHFAGILAPIVAVIDTKDPELSTQVFKTITMLFNFLRIQLLKDMDAVHKCYFPLLGHPKPFVRDFAAQTLSVLLRRIESPKDLRKYLTTYLKALARGSGADHENLRDGSAKLFFSLIKNVNHGFHSRMNEIFVALLGAFRPREGGDEDEESEELVRALVFDIAARTTTLMVRYTDETHVHEMLASLSLVLTKMIAKGARNTAADRYLARVLGLVLDVVKHKIGKLITLREANIRAIHELCATLLAPSWILTTTSEELRAELLRFFDLVWRLIPAEDDNVVVAQVAHFFRAATTDENAAIALYWRTELLAWIDRTLAHAHVTVSFVRASVLPHALRLAFDTFLLSDLDAFTVLVTRIGDYMTTHEDDFGESQPGVQELLVFRHGYRFLATATHGETVLTLTRDAVSAALDDPTDSTQRALAWMLCRALALLDVDERARRCMATPLLARVSKQIDGNDDLVEWRVLRAELWRLEQIATHQLETMSTILSSKTPFVWQALGGHEQSYAMLAAFLAFLKMQSRATQRALLPASLLVEAECVFARNLRSPSRALRLVTLEILARFERLPFVETHSGDGNEQQEGVLVGECDLLDHALHAELLCGTVSVQVEREILRHVSRVQILGRSTQTPSVYRQIAVHHLFGLFHVKFATLWGHVADAIASIAHAPQTFSLIWPCMRDELWRAAFRGELPASTVTPTSTLFARVCGMERGDLDASSVTDILTHHHHVFQTLTRCIDLVETKTKFVVPVFLLFVRDQYAAIYTDELDGTKHEMLDVALVKATTSDWNAHYPTHYPRPTTTTKAVRQRLIDYLTLFAAFRNMKGAFAQSFLHTFFFDCLLMKADDQVSKLALSCLFGFGKKELGAYKDALLRLADASTFRDELTTFNVTEGAGVVLIEHRATLLPVLMRLLYAKAVSKKGRHAGDTVGARRAAILSYLAGLAPSELVYFIELVVRAFDVVVDVDAMEPRSVVQSVPHVSSVQPSRVLGFLNLVEDLIAQLGVHLAVFVPSLADVLVAVLDTYSSDQDQDDSHDDVEMATTDNDHDDETEAPSGKTLAMHKQIRMLAYRRLAELVDALDARVDIAAWVRHALGRSNQAILRLPGAVVGADKPSALMTFVVAVAGAERARRELSTMQIQSVVQCLSSGLSDNSSRGIAPEILAAVLQCLSGLLDGDEEDNDKPHQLIPHIPFVLEQFVLRFQSKAARYAQDRYAGSSKRELVFLCRMSPHLETAATSSSHEQQTAALALFQLLLPFLQRNHHTSTTDKENILTVLAQLVALLVEPKKHVAALAKLLAPGPNGLTERSVRARLLDVFVAIGRHRDALEMADVATALVAMNAFDAKKIEEIDLDTRIDAISSVNARAFEGLTHDGALLTPVLAQYLQCMHESEFALRSTALAGVTAFLQRANTCQDPTERGVLLHALESLVLPCVRASVKSPSEETRRGFVLLLATLADCETLHALLPVVPADLALLRNRDDVEVDFFYNLTHIQVHRKRRALQKLGTLMIEMAKDKDASDDAASKDVVMRDGDDEEEEEDEDDAVVMVSAASHRPTRLSNATVHHLLLPLVLHFIYEAQAKSQESLRQEAAQCIGAAAGLLGWSHYLALLRRLLKSIDGHGDMEQAIMTSVCCVIDNYHFTTEAPTAATMDGWQQIKTQQGVKNEDEHAFKVQDQMEAQVLPMLKKYLFKAVTAKGAQRLHKGGTTSFDDAIASTQHVAVRVPLALAIVKVLRRLRITTFYLEFPKLLVSLTKLLKSKQDDVRASARTTLVKIVGELGTPFLLPVVEELRHTLADGYMVDVLAYTLHTVLDKVSTIAKPIAPRSLLDGQHAASPPSDLDACLPSILSIIVEDLFRNVVENQDGSAAHKSKMKEAKSTSKSYDSLELLARSITFLPNASIHTIVAVVMTKFQEQPENAKGVAVLQEAMRRIALGLVKNPSAERSHVFLYAYNVLASSLEAIRPATDAEKAKLAATTTRNAFTTEAWQISEKSAAAVAQLARRVDARDAARVTLQSKMTGFNRHEIDDVTREQSRTHLDELLTFAVYLLFAFVRETKTSRDDDVALVDPLVPLLMRCASESKNNRAVINALKCLGVLLHREDDTALPSLDVALTPLVDRLFKILQKAGAATRGNELVQTCYRTLTVVLRHRPTFRLTEAQLRVVVSFVRADLDETDHQNATYALLKSIIASRLVIPEIYDVVVRVGEILVQSVTQSARANCATIYITFLLEYPLGPKRLTQHLHFLIKNLTYEYESGRRAVLETLGALAKKLPLELINDRAQFLLLPLVLRLANDEASTCRTLAADAIRTLIKRMGNHALNESVALIAKWWTNPKDKKLLATAAQVTTLVLDCRGEFLDKHADAILTSARTELRKRLDDLEHVDESAALAFEWSVVVHVLSCVERFSECLVARYEMWLLENDAFLSMDLVALLEYPHADVRLGALRVIGSYVRRRSVATLTFASEKKIKKVTAELTTRGATYLQSSGRLFVWTSRVCKLLERPEVGDELATEVLVVLSFLCAALHAHPEIAQHVSKEAPATTTVGTPQITTPLDKSTDHDASESDESEDDTADAVVDEATAARYEQDEREQSKTPLGWVLTRLSYVARGAPEAVQTTIYKFFALFIHDHDVDVVRQFVVQMINPLYRAASALEKKDPTLQVTRKHTASVEDEPPASALLAREVLERLEQTIGATEFLESYTFVQKKLAVFRATRREKRKRDLMNDPELAARRKLHKNEGKRRAKQQKKRKFAVLKGTISAATRPNKVLRPGAE